MAHYTVITGTGCYIPPIVKTNKEFVGQTFYADDEKITFEDNTESNVIIEI